MSPSIFRYLPAVHKVLEDPALASLLGRYPQPQVVEAVRTVLDELRNRVARTSDEGEAASLCKMSAVVDSVSATLTRRFQPSLREVINATGVIIHTNLGRAPLGEGLWDEARSLLTGYSNLEFDLEQGQRGSRFVHSQGLLQQLTGASDSLVVNNNAAAVLLVLTALARGKEVLVSRGELIEIGGSFRIPDIMAQGGAVLREVGTTNKTSIKDFEEAIGPRTGMILKAHQSNYSIRGFTREVPRTQLASLARERSIPFYEDMGSGLVFPLDDLGLPGKEPVEKALKEGAQIVSFSGDKLLGGPQAGIIVGSSQTIGLLRRHPLTRALRPDKFTLSLLEAVALSYLRNTHLTDIPTARMLAESIDSLELAARQTLDQLTPRPGLAISVTRCESRVGGGALPEEVIPSAGLRIQGAPGEESDLEAQLRMCHPPIVARISQGAVVLDYRTILPRQRQEMADFLNRIVAHRG